MNPALTGRATPEATAQWFRGPGADLAPVGGAMLGSTGLRVSGVGFGSRLIDFNNSNHATALAAALRGGVNLIDTAADFGGGGGAEALIGRVLGELADSGEITRDRIVVVTKAGAIEGLRLRNARARETEGKLWGGVVKPAENRWHCIDPEFLEGELAGSLERLGLDAVDVLLLQNPEDFLKHAHQTGKSIDEARPEYEARLKRAFEWLEAQAATGRIGCYGIASNTLAASPGQFDFIGLERCLELAREISADHKFKAIELPMNLIERGAWSELNQADRTRSVLDVAREAGLGVLANRPIAAFSRRGAIRLADPPGDLGPRESEIGALIAALAETENEARGMLSESEPSESFGQVVALDLAGLVHREWRDIHDGEAWNQFVPGKFIPRSQDAMNALIAALRSNPEFSRWQGRFQRAVNTLLRALADYFEVKARVRLEAIHAAIAPAAPEERAGATLSRKAVWTVRSIPGVTSVLVGMRRPEYVEESLAVARVALGELGESDLAEMGEKLERLV